MTALLQRVGPVLKITGQVAQGIALTSIFLMNGLMGYIMFAPDDLPKPFYLSYAGDVAVVSAAASTSHTTEGEAVATEGPEIIKIYKPGQGVMVETGTKIVNLADPGGRRYLKATITIEVAPPETTAPATEAAAAEGSHGSTAAATEDPVMAEFTDKMNQRLPIINDILTTLLSGQTFESIYTVEGKEALRQDILVQLNERMPDLQVISVYFTEFVVQ
ncbi:MAG: flagellar basal body-associated FliL family protein [Anaerolineales bacterium]|nr:flagellar basal body-associated FliL family protein [Anaerolineales bacterium]